MKKTRTVLSGSSFQPVTDNYARPIDPHDGSRGSRVPHFFFDSRDTIGALDAINRAAELSSKSLVAVFKPLAVMPSRARCIGHSPKPAFSDSGLRIGFTCQNCGQTVSEE